MAGDDGGGTIAILLVFVCCIVSCAIGLIVWASGGSLSSVTDVSKLREALKKITFTRAEQPNLLNYNTAVTGAYGYGRVRNAVTVPGSDLGSIVTGKTSAQCDDLCHTTTGCFGYTVDGTNCQLKNNVTVLDYKPNVDNLYASQDVGGFLYEHFPYERVEDGLIPASHTWTFTGSFINAVSNCHMNSTKCKGFTWDGNSTAVMYPQIYAVDGTKPKTGQAGVYTIPDNPPLYVAIPGKTYSDTPTTTVTTVPQWALPQPFNPTSDSDYFTNVGGPKWQGGAGWSAGPDSYAQRLDGLAYGPGSHVSSNTITVASLNGCMNACVANTWCQSFTYDNSVKSCYMRRDQVAWPGRDIDAPTQQACVAVNNGIAGPANKTCGCGFQGGSTTNCNNNIIRANAGKSDGNKVSYVRKNPPLPQYCPQQCKNNIDCKLAWYDTSNGNCNMYEFAPTQAGSGSAATQSTTWMLENFPG